MPWRHPRLNSCWERLNRAEAHRKAFADTWNSLLEDEPYNIVVEVEDNGEGSIRVFPGYEPLPPVLSLELGEMLYQLRAALDSLVYGLAIIDSGQDPPPDENRLEFPVRSSRVKFDEVAWKMRPLTDEHRNMIESIQPYHAKPEYGHRLNFVYDSLTFINDWARKDRHRRLHVVGSWASNRNPQVFLPDGGEVAWLVTGHDGLLEHESEIARFFVNGWEPGMQVEANPDLTIDVALDEPPEPRDDTDTLSKRARLMCATVRIILESFEDHLAGPKPRGVDPLDV